VTNEELKRFKRRLVAEEHYLQREIEGQIAELEDATEASGEERVSAADDASAQLFEHEKTLAVEGAFEEMVAEVQHALHKIATGNYGVCDDCGQPIAIARLEVRPQATQCVPCRTREELSHSGHRYATAKV
jgi:DnaK suppressor protein